MSEKSLAQHLMQKVQADSLAALVTMTHALKLK
jgi:hypothetical protein